MFRNFKPFLYCITPRMQNTGFLEDIILNSERIWMCCDGFLLIRKGIFSINILCWLAKIATLYSNKLLCLYICYHETKHSTHLYDSWSINGQWCNCTVNRELHFSAPTPLEMACKYMSYLICVTIRPALCYLKYHVKNSITPRVDL